MDTLDKLFDYLFSYYPDVTVAGGYLRDTALERPVKDMDVFINGSARHYELREFGFSQERGGYSAPYVNTVHTHAKIGEVPVQLVFCSVATVDVVMKGFDFNICKCYTVGRELNAVYSDKFLKDAEACKLTLEFNPELHNGTTVMLHGQRIKEKYDWPIEVKYVS